MARFLIRRRLPYWQKRRRKHVNNLGTHLLRDQKVCFWLFQLKQFLGSMKRKQAAEWRQQSGVQKKGQGEK